MVVDDRLGNVDQLVAVVLRVVAQHVERTIGVDPVAGHQDALCLFDRSAATERALQAVVVGKPLQGDVDRALQFLGARVDDVGEDPALGGLVNIGGILDREQRDHRAGGLRGRSRRSARGHARNAYRNAKLSNLGLGHARSSP
jgi:hypothetical protein